MLGLSGSELAEVEGIIASEIEANMGMAMIYTVVCALKEWLENQVRVSFHIANRPHVSIVTHLLTLFEYS